MSVPNQLTGEVLLVIAYRTADALCVSCAADRDDMAQVIAMRLWVKRAEVNRSACPLKYAYRSAFRCGLNRLKAEGRRVRREYGLVARAVEMHRAGKFDLPGG